MKTYLKGVLYMSINNLSSFTKERLGLCIENDTIDNNLYEEYGVKRGLRDLQHFTKPGVYNGGRKAYSC